MEDHLRSKYNRISVEREALIRNAQILMNKANKLLHEMKCILKEHNGKTNHIKAIYDLDNPPDIIVNNTFDIKYLLSMPDDIFQHHFVQYLSIKDIGQFDNAVTNVNHRSQYLEKLANNIVGKNLYVDRLSLLWFKKKKLYLSNISIRKVLKKSNIIDVHEVFRHCEGLDFKLCTKNHNILSLIISQCSNLKSLKLSREFDDYSTILVDNFSKYCIGLHSLQLIDCGSVLVTDESIISISHNCSALQLLDLNWCRNITDESIISIAKNCTGLQSLNLNKCSNITDESIISISKSCTGLQSLNLTECTNITDESIISIAKYCKGLQLLDLTQCNNIKDESIISVSNNCTRLQSLNISWCWNITDESVISISENCTGLQSLALRGCDNITDESIITISNSCTGLQTLNIIDCYTITDAAIKYLSKNCKTLISESEDDLFL